MSRIRRTVRDLIAGMSDATGAECPPDSPTKRRRTNQPYQPTGVRTSATQTPRQARRRVGGAEKARVIARIAEALTRHSYPPLDARAKSIVASQIGTLLKGGWDEAEVTKTAVALALDWDTQRGFSKLLHLTERQRAKTADEQREKHEESKREEARRVVTATGPDGTTIYIGHVPELVGDRCKCGKTVREHRMATRADLRHVGGYAAQIADRAGAVS